MTISLSTLSTRALVLDIEGTTTPIEFVYQVLFPFARGHAAAYLEREWDSPACRGVIARLRAEHAHDADPEGHAGKDFGPASALAYVHHLMDLDRKSPGLKALQGLIWQDGFTSGELRGQVYADVPPAFERWRARGLEIYIYSSGSVLAQRLLFGSTTAGDLTKFLSGYFDTSVGPKASPVSYLAIAAHVRTAPSGMLFVSDVAQELEAAASAGLRTALCVRQENGPRPGAHPVIRTFDQIAD